jgi:hypothetical protein
MDNRESFIRRSILPLAVFSIAMGFLEAVVVVYLRKLYYPEGFEFPLRMLAIEGLSLESLREISTIVILLSVSIIAGRTTYEKFSFFLYCFGIWDIFYYVWLKVLLNWPSSLFTWDVLFLIPVIWVGPVLAPIILSITMIVVSMFILYFQDRGYPIRITIPGWSLMSAGAFFIFITFIWDYSRIIMKAGILVKLSSFTADSHLQKVMTGYVPTTYNWSLFILGEGLILSFLLIFIKRMKSAR